MCGREPIAPTAQPATQVIPGMVRIAFTTLHILEAVTVMAMETLMVATAVMAAMEVMAVMVAKQTFWSTCLTLMLFPAVCSWAEALSDIRGTTMGVVTSNALRQQIDLQKQQLAAAQQTLTQIGVCHSQNQFYVTRAGVARCWDPVASFPPAATPSPPATPPVVTTPPLPTTPVVTTPQSPECPAGSVWNPDAGDRGQCMGNTQENPGGGAV